MVQPLCSILGLPRVFVEAKSDTSLFVFRRGANLIYLLLYVHDIVLTASSTLLLRRIITAEFSMDLGNLHRFLGMQVQRWPDGPFLSQRQYMQEILDRAGMDECPAPLRWIPRF